VEFEEVFSSRPRMKILKLIYDLRSLNASKIAQKINMNYSSTVEHLKILESEGLIVEYVYGRVHMYRFNEASEKAKAVAALIEAYEK
jgi:DNA-binding transcriptional ArsR family regulator